MTQLSLSLLLSVAVALCSPIDALSAKPTPTSSPPASSSSSFVASLSSLAHRSAVETGFVEIHQCLDHPEKGLGAFSTRNIASGTYIGEYYGEIVTEAQVQARYYGKATPTADDDRWALDRSSRQQGTTGMYVFELKQENMFVDAEDAERSGWCRFMNHAERETDECNVRAFDKLTIHGELLVYPQFYAVRDIEKGEELCYFYGDHGHLLWEE